MFALPTASLAEDDADFLFEDYEEFFEPDIDNGPWVYLSNNLTVCIRRSTEDKKLCYVADIYIRNNEKAYTGWSHMDPPGLPEELPHIIARRYDAVFGLVGDYLCHRNNKKGVNIRDGKVYFDDDEADVPRRSSKRRDGGLYQRQRYSRRSRCFGSRKTHWLLVQLYCRTESLQRQ